MWILHWIETASAAFVGTGLALVALRFLSGTLLGHWLARGLAKYTAQLETSETGKRVAIERRDRDRAEVLAELMQAVSQYSSLLSFPPVTAASDPRGLEVAFLERCRQIDEVADTVMKITMRGSYLFEIEEGLIALCLAWSSQAKTLAHHYYDAIGEVAERQNYWSLPWAERVTALISATDAAVSKDGTNLNVNLVQLCRKLAAAPT
jgi:hypothetical protein